MSQFYANIQGSRGEATRMGTKNSGMEGHIRGWGSGGKVVMEHIEDKDVCFIYATGGSNYGSRKILIAKIKDGVIHLEKDKDGMNVNA